MWLWHWAFVLCAPALFLFLPSSLHSLYQLYWAELKWNPFTITNKLLLLLYYYYTIFNVRINLCVNCKIQINEFMLPQIKSKIIIIKCIRYKYSTHEWNSFANTFTSFRAKFNNSSNNNFVLNLSVY